MTDSLVSTFNEFLEAYMRRSMRGFILYVKESGLSLSQVGGLMRISHKVGAGVSDLGEHLGMTSAAASQMLERLMQQGLILRSENPEDRRAKQIALTDKGKQVLQESISARQDWVIDVLATLTAEERELVTSALKVLVDKFHQLEATEPADVNLPMPPCAPRD